MSVSVIATSRDGETRELPALDYQSVMEVLRDAGFGDVLALCGGSCSCATCHVYVAESDIGLFEAATEDEIDLLDSADARKPNSRLSCQLKMSGIARDISITVAPEE